MTKEGYCSIRFPGVGLYIVYHGAVSTQKRRGNRREEGGSGALSVTGRVATRFMWMVGEDLVRREKCVVRDVSLMRNELTMLKS